MNVETRETGSVFGRIVAGFRRWQDRQEAKARARAERLSAFRAEAERLYRLSMKPLSQAELDALVTEKGRDAAFTVLEKRLKGQIVEIVRRANEDFRFGLPTFSAVCRTLQELDLAGIDNMHGFELVGWSGTGRIVQDTVKIAEQRRAESQRRRAEREKAELAALKKPMYYIHGPTNQRIETIRYMQLHPSIKYDCKPVYRAGYYTARAEGRL